MHHRFPTFAFILGFTCLLALAGPGAHGVRVLKHTASRRFLQDDPPMVIAPGKTADNSSASNSTSEESSSWETSSNSSSSSNATLGECYPARMFNFSSVSTGEWANDWVPAYFNDSTVVLEFSIGGESAELLVPVDALETVGGILSWTVAGPGNETVCYKEEVQEQEEQEDGDLPTDGYNTTIACYSARKVTVGILDTNYTLDFLHPVSNETTIIDGSVKVYLLEAALPLMVNATGETVDTDIMFTISGPTNVTVCYDHQDEESSYEDSYFPSGQLCCLHNDSSHAFLTCEEMCPAGSEETSFDGCADVDMPDCESEVSQDM